MKKPTPIRFITAVWCSILILAMALVINSCRKDIQLAGQQANIAEANPHLSVNEAKSWFAGNKTALANKIKLNSETSFLSKIADFTPLWDSARTAVDTNYYVVEAPAQYARKILFTTDGTSNINGLTRLLILKNKRNGELVAALMQIHGEPGVNINNVHYMAVPRNFSGNIFYTTLQGLFVNGNAYQNGEITFASRREPPAVEEPTGPQILKLPAPGGCEVRTIGIYEQTCYYSSSDVLEYCDPEVLLFTQDVTYCPGQGDDSSGGYSPPCPPGSSPAPPGTNPPPGGNPTPPIILEPLTINGKKAVRLVQGGDQGSCVINVQDTIKFCDDITTQQKATIENTIAEFKSANCANATLYKIIDQDGSGYTFCIKTGYGSASYSPTDKSISFTTDYAATRADILQHEMFHGYQDLYYPGGTAGYGKNSSTGIASPGFSNIEFEQAVFSDIVNNEVVAFQNGTPEQQTSYRNWLAGLTNDFTSYPKLTSGTTDYNNFIEQYTSFLNQFNNLPNNPLSGPIINLDPKALINLFNQTNCN
ncbi:hypothetical protein GWR56_04465 [Mucilaginibacter sp. 14171R-50]|uniref:hypothetical protein n=1 Tax=Mucilaginibacter sp. 14171R-50 TaxID=2703789 RepID=UPI00138D74BB|nr:hypothetical protein [Mucilaginibacter sp. 14171R-50]QHS54835.1 hypothetical protein GWR56_04465 [Mucilaginibacter sp. 14171R-50]